MNTFIKTIQELESSCQTLNMEIFDFQRYRIELTIEIKLLVAEMLLDSDFDIDVAEMELKIRYEYLAELIFEITQKNLFLENSLESIENLKY